MINQQLSWHTHRAKSCDIRQQISDNQRNFLFKAHCLHCTCIYIQQKKRALHKNYSLQGVAPCMREGAMSCVLKTGKMCLGAILTNSPLNVTAKLLIRQARQTMRLHNKCITTYKQKLNHSPSATPFCFCIFFSFFLLCFCSEPQERRLLRMGLRWNSSSVLSHG